MKDEIKDIIMKLAISITDDAKKDNAELIAALKEKFNNNESLYI